MKTIKITITGDLQAIDYCSTTLYSEDEDFYGNYYLMLHWEKLDKMTVNDGEENVIKQKGKYIKTKEYLHEKFREDGDHPLPVECHVRTYYNQEVSYYIELEDDEEFDIKKLQMLKSDYECDAYPYLIVGDYIMYDGKKAYVEEDADDYCPETKCHDDFIIDELY